MNALVIPSAATSATDLRVFDVLLSRRDGVEAGLLALRRRAARKNLPVLAWTWGRAFVETVSREAPDGSRQHVEIARVPLTLPIEAPRYAGWTFVAALQHLDGENLVRSIPGETVSVEYRTRGPVCDHCRSKRRRSDTYVLRHDDGRLVQVGSTCIADFLGSDDAGKLAALATLLADAASLAGDDEEGSCGGRGASAYVLSQYLPLVAWEVRALGWVSRTAARERVGCTASADHAWSLMVDPEKARRDGLVVEVTAEDAALAAAAEEWAESLSDATVDAEKGDYLHNLRAVARTGLVSSRTAGIAASTIVAYQRFLGFERERAERTERPQSDSHVGVVGERGRFLVALDFVTGYESNYGYVTLLKFRALGPAEGATLVWKTSSTDLGRADVGKSYKLSGTVKKHDEYKGAKQTIVTRCKVLEKTVAEIAEAASSPTEPMPRPRQKKKKTSESPRVDRDALVAHRDTHDDSNSWWAYDVRGIPLCRVCDACERAALAAYRPEVTGRGPGRYEDAVEEQVEES